MSSERYSFDVGSFDSGDAAILGGILGFAEEAFRDENFSEDANGDIHIDVDSGDIKDVNLRLVYNQDPEFFKYIVRLVIKHNRKWKNERLAREALKVELDALKRSEELLKEIEDVGE